MTFTNPPDETIKRILNDAKTVAIVGLSDNPARDSYHVGHYLKTQGYRIIPINPNVHEVLDETAIATLQHLTVPVDIVNVFRRSDALLEVVQNTLHLEAPVIWTQLGVYNEQAAEIAQQNGKTMIMDRCIKIEHHCLLGEK